MERVAMDAHSARRTAPMLLLLSIVVLLLLLVGLLLPALLLLLLLLSTPTVLSLLMLLSHCFFYCCKVQRYRNLRQSNFGKVNVPISSPFPVFCFVVDSLFVFVIYTTLHYTLSHFKCHFSSSRSWKFRSQMGWINLWVATRFVMEVILGKSGCLLCHAYRNAM